MSEDVDGARGADHRLASEPQPPTLRALFLMSAVVAFIPLLVFSAAVVGLFAREERETFRQGATARTLALVTAVDTELKRSIAALEALATSDALDDGDLESFHGEAARVLGSRPEWLTVTLASSMGDQVLNLLRPVGSELDRAHDPLSFREVWTSEAPAVGSLFREPLTGSHVFAVRVPVRRNDRTIYVLSALVKPDPMEALLSPQGLPTDWVGVVLDGSENIVARTVGSERTVGQPASESLRAALRRATGGWFEGSTIEGWPVYTPFNRSSFSGWTVAMGIPESAVESPLRRSLGYLLSFGVSLLLLALTIAWTLSRRGARSLEELAAMAERLGSEEDSVPAAAEARANATVSEVEELKRAFTRAAALVRARSQDRDRVEASLREVQAALRESDRRKDDFLAMLGHELRNPLGVIANAVHVLRTTRSADARTGEIADTMARQVEHMSRMLNDLLDVSRIAQGRIQLDRNICDVVALVRETSEDYRETLERGGLTLRLQLPDRPLWVMGDRTRLAQAVANLLHNAHKFTDAGGTVTVRVEEVDGGEAALVSVSDTGVGMEQEMLERAFQVFSQADRTIERSQGGLGLGLALVRELVRLHGGEARATSEGANRGSEISMRLPLQPATVSPPGPGSRSVAPTRRFRILVVEDNVPAARSLEMYLTHAGHTVDVAHTGPEAIERARAFQPQVVLCDIGLPGSNGYDVARSLSRERDDVYLIALTGYGQDADRERARVAGFDRHLTKPVDLEGLGRILSALPVAAG